MLGILKKIFDDNERELKKLARQVEEVNSFEPKMQALSDEALRAKTAEFKERLAAGETLDNLLPEAFAVVREASRRTLGLRHFDEQIMGGIVLHQGRIAEMKTGEGKTLVATLPAYLNALTGQGVHIVTVNDYLAKRDSEWMGAIYKFLGLSVGLILHDMDFAARREAYAADITYGTNNEFGFDYLRDNMVLYPEQMVQRGFNYAIIDEVDSILIDEARTPLIISGQAEQSTDLYYKFARIVPQLKRDVDYTVDEKARTVAPTEEGVAKVERMLGVANLYDESEGADLAHYLLQALRAHVLMQRDRDYVVKDGQVIIVDEFTGRLMFGRRYSDGLHQAIEAKEGVKIKEESQTLARITFQNFFRMYKKLAGMTGTAATEEEEFRKIYGLDVVVIPTHKPMIRVDYPDVVYKTEAAKFKAVVEEIAECHKRGQPVLVGTVSIEKSERLSAMLKRRGIPHQVLNAKYHEKEAEIIAQAGRLGAVTIATNMAGRGTDILLGGNPDFLTRAELIRQGKNPQEVDRETYQAIYREMKKQTDAEHDQVVALGGLHIIGTERHEARRIDNQLRGRSGRQGDPGSSRFYLSLEDDLLRLFGGESIAKIMERLGLEEDQPIEHPLLTRAVENAQKKVEAKNFEIRKQLLEYDDVMNTQREVIYRQRREVLLGDNHRDTILSMARAVLDDLITTYCSEHLVPEEWDLSGLLTALEQTFFPPRMLTLEDLKGKTRAELVDFLRKKIEDFYAAREAEIGAETLRELERVVLLRVVDSKWMEHLDNMDGLREGIGLRAYGQHDPLVEYKREAYEMFQGMVARIQEDTVRYLFKVRVEKRAPERRSAFRNVSTNAESGPQQPFRRQGKKIGRNDPCPCGSGKKYKKCCGRDQA
ncbi:MAG: preprotein translocase subunit SecA [Bacillota bacterium]|jgi:preprotein translocase subunit SecA|nr:preprotein translocase subunit SecA [Bacillota bacterium]